MGFRFLLLFCLGLLCSPSVQAQKAARKIKKEADDFFSKEKYDEALRLYRQYHRMVPNDLEGKYKLGVSAYHENQLVDAERFLSYVLENNKKPDVPDLFLFGKDGTS